MAPIFVIKMMNYYRKQSILQAAEFQPLATLLSIIQNFSLGFLCIALHNRPGDLYEQNKTER